VPETYHTQINDALLTALGRALGEFVGSPAVVVDLEGHGREDIAQAFDLSRTVGWFTSISPILLKTSPGEDIGMALKRVKEQIRAVPHKGIGYGILRYLSVDRDVADVMTAIPPAALSFNYLGQFDQVLTDQWLEAAEEKIGNVQLEQGAPRYPLYVNSMVRDGRLEVVWTFSANLREPDLIERLADSYMKNLDDIIAHCTGGAAGGFTPSDFPLANLDEEKFGKLALLLGKHAAKNN
jgi:non-ribosomal peptide synthase protein (TIGR01720 family)